jgi:uncharacterized DUF497 family protein
VPPTPDKTIVYTRHAEDVMREREIDRAWVEATVREPDWTVPDATTQGAERRFKAISSFGDRTLRVACLESDAHVRILTVFFDRKARRP